MKIVRSQKYTYALQTILRFISLDSKTRALTFKKELDKHINTLDSMPYRCRKSHYFDSNKIRDLIVKGYHLIACWHFGSQKMYNKLWTRMAKEKKK